MPRTFSAGKLGRVIELAGVAKDIRTAKRSTDAHVCENARKHLALRLGRLHGLPQKIGQMLSMSDDRTAADAFVNLTDSAEALPFDVIGPILERSWGKAIESVVTEIDPKGMAASLGQVHRATLIDGCQVAIKVAYPGIRKAVNNDLKMLGWLSAPVGDLRRGFDLTAYRREITRNLAEELDYHVELKNLQDYRSPARSHEGVVIPAALPELCSDTILVTQWEQGQSIEEVERWPAAHREELARVMLRHFLTMLFDHGLIHGDPHPGNYRFRLSPTGDPSFVLFDFGSVARLEQRDRLLLLRLILDTVAMEGDPLTLLSELGFDRDLLEPIKAKLPAVCHLLFDPFRQPLKFDMDQWNRRERLDDVLGDDRWNFRMAGPAKLILLMRAFRGILFYLERLGQPISWERILRPIADRHEPSARALILPQPASDDASFSAMGRHLRVAVRRDGVTKVSLTLPVMAIEDLDGLMEPDLISRVEQKGTSLAAIVRNVRQRGYAPGEIFEIESDDAKQVRVWIE